MDRALVAVRILEWLALDALLLGVFTAFMVHGIRRFLRDLEEKDYGDQKED